MTNNPDDKIFKDNNKTETGSYITKIRNRSIYACLLTVFGIIAGLVLVLSGYRIAAIILLGLTAISIVFLTRVLSSISATVMKSVNDYAITNKRNEELINYFSHKIREPLNNILIINNIFKSLDIKVKYPEIIENMDLSTNSMVSAVDELALQSAGNMILEPRNKLRFNVHSTIQNTIDLYCQRNDTNITFSLNEGDLFNKDCIGDPVIVKQIILGILERIDNIDKVPVKLTINYQTQELNRKKSLLGIKLQTNVPVRIMGTGNTSDILPARLIAYAKGSFDQIIEKDTSYLNIWLPIDIAEEKSRKQITSHKMEELIQKNKVKKDLNELDILLAEDNPINKEITMMTLKPIIKSIDTANNGKEALELFGRSSYDIVLMDIQMPIMDGLTAAQKIRELETGSNTHVPIIAITANAMLGDKEKCLAAGFDEYISKPFHPSSLIDIIKRYL